MQHLCDWVKGRSISVSYIYIFTPSTDITLCDVITSTKIMPDALCRLANAFQECLISLGSHQNIGLHTGARANVVLLTYLLTYIYIQAQTKSMMTMN